MRIFGITKGSNRAVRSLTPRLLDFKQRYCDENVLIAEAIRHEFTDFLRSPILDVGAGLGDIAAAAFPEHQALLLDTEERTEPIAARHRRVVGDFFEFARAGGDKDLGTILFSHVLQYIDDDLAELRRAVSELAPASVITVTNDNTGTFGDLVAWATKEMPECNPEFAVSPVPLETYEFVKAVPFMAVAQFPEFRTMAEDFVTMFLDTEPTHEALAAMERELRAKLDAPIITINETIRSYERRN